MALAPRARFLPALWLLLSACSSKDHTEGSSHGPANQAQTPPDGGEWETLATGSWKLAPGGEEVDHCVKVTLTEDIYVAAIRPIHPKGTHHTFVALSDTADGVRCTAAVAAGQLIYAAGLGSEGIHMPAGVAMKLPAGKVLNLSLHIYNPNDTELSGTSGLQIVRMAAADVKSEAETTLAGPFTLSIPPGRSTVTHQCKIADEQTAFVLFPHMHQLGVHFKTAVTLGGVESVLHDADYNFGEQFQIPIDPIKFSPGDIVSTECTYENPAGRTVTFGESSDTEMCFSVLFRYPATGVAFCKSPAAASP